MAAALRCRCSPAIWAAQMTWPAGWAAACGAVPVITTATDANSLFAVDEWAKKQNCAVWETPRIKLVSGALLAGKTVRYASPWAIAAPRPPVWRKPKNRLALILP